MDCTIEGITFKVNEFEVINELDGIVISVHDNGYNTLRKAMFEGRYLDVLLHDGDYMYKFLAIVNKAIVNKCKGDSLYYMQSCAQITLTSIGE
jgi:phosphodiesterase/alkaline phosphatase D-like protein